MRNPLPEPHGAPLADTLQPGTREPQLDVLRGTLHDLEAELADYDRDVRSEGLEHG